jgi:SOS response regulatory protein OraA/RecX
VLSSKKIDEKDPYKYKAKLAQYAIQKGFQPSLVWQTINEKN